MTVRNLPDPVHAALLRERQRRGQSLNQTVIELLGQALAVGTARINGLARLAGTWTDEEARSFEVTTGRFEEVDEDLWR